jgi:hypothetical protein
MPPPMFAPRKTDVKLEMELMPLNVPLVWMVGDLTLLMEPVFNAQLTSKLALHLELLKLFRPVNQTSS